MDSTLFNQSFWILLLPLFSFGIGGLFVGRKNWQAAAWLATGSIAIAWLLVGIGLAMGIVGPAG